MVWNNGGRRNMERKNDFTKGSISGTILRLAVPMIVAQLINVLYNIVDRIYVGHIPGAGTLPLTGLGLAFPIITIITAFTNLCGQGGAPLCSMDRGAGNDREAEQIIGNACTMLLILSVLVTAAGLIWKRDILTLFGASGDTLPYADAYITIYLAGTVFSMLGLGLNAFISAQGFARTSMLTIGIGAVINIALDPVFIFALDMGVAGAALATILSQLCSMLWVLQFLTGKKALLRLRAENLRLDLPLCGRILALGLSNFVVSITNSAVQIFSNATLSIFGGDLYVGVMTVVTSVHEVVMKPVQSLTAGAQPVTSYNYGARERGRVLECIRFMTLACGIYCVVATVVALLLPGPFISLFDGEGELLEAGIPALRIYFCAFFLMFLQLAGQSTFVSLGMSRHAICFSLLRKAVIVVPLTVLLPRLGLGVWGVFWAEPVSCLVGCPLCYLTMRATVVRRLRREIAAGPEKET